MSLRALSIVLGTAMVGLASADRIDDVIRETMAIGRVPGAILLVSRDGKPVRVSTYGVANLETTAAVRRNTAFEIGSVSKQFTAAAVLLLVDDGKLSLDDTVGKHLPDAPELWRPLTLRQMLSHTSGLKDSMQTPDDAKFRADDYFKKLGTAPLDFEPGTSWAYSNLGYNLAAMVVEKVSGTQFPKFMAERIFKPLGLKETRFTDPVEVVSNRARGYVPTAKGWQNAGSTYPPTLLGAGAILSTADDVARWDHAIVTGRLLKPQTLKEFFTPVGLKSGSDVPYALGWFIGQDQGRPIWEHGGNTLGFSCSNLYLPKEKTSIVFLTNVGGLGGSSVTRRIAARLFRAYDLSQRKAEPDPNPQATSQLMMTFRQFGKGQYKNLDVFAPAMKGTMASFRGALSRMGYGNVGKNLKTYRHLDSEAISGGRRLSRYALRLGETGTLYLQVTWTADGHAEGLSDLYAERTQSPEK